MITTVYRSKGKDERGVPLIQVIQGKWNWASVLWCAYGVGGGLFFFYMAFRLVNSPSPGIHAWAWFVNLLLGIMCLFSALQTINTRRHLEKLMNAGAVSLQLGVDTQTLNAFAEAQGIKPRYNINGEDFYDLKDFGDAAVLLRASVAPSAQPETLLRPAAGTIAPAENLLRSSAEPPFPQE